MATKIYPVDIEILIKPVGEPKCRISIDDQRQDLTVDKEMQIQLFHQGHGLARLAIEHYDKAELDPTTALIIEEIKFNINFKKTMMNVLIADKIKRKYLIDDVDINSYLI